MDLKQFEYFVIVADCGSINKAAEVLFTTQPNVSKVIASLERELKRELFNRSNKGVKLTQKGFEVYDYAKVILKNTEIMLSMNKIDTKKKISIASYPSHIVSRIVCDYYNKYDDIKVDFFEGTVEETVNNVSSNKCDVGIVYVNEHKKCCLNHVLEHKSLEFEEISIKKSCIYLGKNNDFYNRDYITLEEVFSLKFVQPIKDVFSMENYLDFISNNINKKHEKVITTNSDNLVIDMLLTTDVASFGIDLMYPEYNQYDIKSVEIKDHNDKIYIGYIKRRGEELSKEVVDFLDLIKYVIK